jgi:hypothetical protein
MSAILSIVHAIEVYAASVNGKGQDLHHDCNIGEEKRDCIKYGELKSCSVDAASQGHCTFNKATYLGLPRNGSSMAEQGHLAHATLRELMFMPVIHLQGSELSPTPPPLMNESRCLPFVHAGANNMALLCHRTTIPSCLSRTRRRGSSHTAETTVSKA